MTKKKKLATMENAKALLPLLRRAVRLNVMRWDAEREIEQLIGCEIEYSDYDDLCVSVDEPTVANVRRIVGKDDAKLFLEQVERR